MQVLPSGYSYPHAWDEVKEKIDSVEEGVGIEIEDDSASSANSHVGLNRDSRHLEVEATCENSSFTKSCQEVDSTTQTSLAQADLDTMHKKTPDHVPNDSEREITRLRLEMELLRRENQKLLRHLTGDPLVGTWMHGDLGTFTISPHKGYYKFNNGGSCGALTKQADWFQGSVFRDDQLIGEIRVRAQDLDCVFSVRFPGQTLWESDMIAERQFGVQVDSTDADTTDAPIASTGRIKLTLKGSSSFACRDDDRSLPLRLKLKTPFVNLPDQDGASPEMLLSENNPNECSTQT